MRTLYRNRAPELRLMRHVTVGLNRFDSEKLDRLAKTLGATYAEVVRVAIQNLNHAVDTAQITETVKKEREGK